MAIEGDDSDLLMKLQADVADGLAALRSLGDEMKGLRDVTSDLQESFKGLTDASGDTKEAFSKHQASVITLSTAYSALSEAVRDARELFEKVAGGALDAVEAFGRQAQALENINNSLGVSTQFYQTLQLQFAKVGESSEGARTSLTYFERAVEQARTGSERLRLVFEALGTDLSGSSSIEQMFLQTMEGLNQYKGSTELARGATEIFSRQVINTLPAMLEMGKHAEENKREALELGAAWDDTAKALGTRASTAFSSLEESMESLGVTWTVVLGKLTLPVLEDAAAALRKFTIFVHEHRDAIVNLTEALAVAFGFWVGTRIPGLVLDLIPKLVAFAATIMDVVEAVRAFDIAEAIATGGLGLLTGMLAAGTLAWYFWGRAAADAGEAAKAAAAPGFTPLSAHGGGPGGQQQNIALIHEETDALDKEKTAEEEAHVARVRRTQGEIAATKAQTDAEIAQLGRRYDAIRAKRAEQTPGGKLPQPEEDALRIAQAAEARGIVAKGQAALADIQDKTTDEVARARIAAEEKVQEKTLEIQAATAKAQLAMGLITKDQELAIEEDLERQRGAMQLKAAQEEAKYAGPDPKARQEAADKELTIQATTNAKLAELDQQRQTAQYEDVQKQRDLYYKVAKLSAQAYGDQQQEQLIALAQAHEEMVRKIKASGHLEYIAEVDKAYQGLEDRQRYGFVDLGASEEKAVTTTFEGIVSGTRKLQDSFKGIGESLFGDFTSWMTKSLKEKVGFDTVLQGNFFKTIPGYAEEGASKVGQVWSNLWNWLSHGTGTAPDVKATAAGVSAPGGIGGISSTPGPGAAPAPGGPIAPVTVAPTTVVLQGTPGQAAGVSRLAAQGFSSDQIAALQQGALSGTEAGAPAPAAAPAGGDATGGLGGIGIGVATYGASVILDLATNGKQRLKQFYDSVDLLSKVIGVRDVANAAGGGGLVGAIGGLIGEAEHALGTGGLGKILGFELDPLGLLKVPSLVDQLAKGLGIAFQKAGLPVAKGGFQKQPFGQFTPTDARAAAMEVLGFPGTPGKEHTLQDLLAYFGAGKGGKPYGSAAASGTLLGLGGIADPTLTPLLVILASLLGPKNPHPDLGINIPKWQSAIAASQASPGIEGLLPQTLALGAATSGGRPLRTSIISNELLNNFEKLGITTEEANRELLKFANEQGIPDAATGIERLNKEFLHGNLTELQLVTTTTGMTKLFNEELSPAIDIASFALADFAEKGGINIAHLQKQIDEATKLVQGFDFSSAIQAGLTGGSFEATLRQSLSTTIIQGMSDAISMSPPFATLFSKATGDLTDAYLAFKSGDTQKASTLIVQAGTEMQAASQSGQDFINTLLAANPEIQAMFDNAQAYQEATQIATQTLNDTLSTITTPSDQERVAQAERINALNEGISKARAFGDEVSAAGLEMELATEKAAQAMSGGAGAGQAFLFNLRKNVRDAIQQAIVQAVVNAQIIQAVLGPWLQTVTEQARRVVADPSAAADAFNVINAGWAGLQPAINGLMDLIGRMAPLIASAAPLPGTAVGGGLGLGSPSTTATGVPAPTISSGYQSGGVVPGNGPSYHMLHGGEAVFTPAQLAALPGLYTSASTIANALSIGSIGINLQFGSELANADVFGQYRAEAMAKQILESFMQQLQQQIPLEHWH